MVVAVIEVMVMDKTPHEEVMFKLRSEESPIVNEAN